MVAVLYTTTHKLHEAYFSKSVEVKFSNKNRNIEYIFSELYIKVSVEVGKKNTSYI